MNRPRHLLAVLAVLALAVLGPVRPAGAAEGSAMNPAATTTAPVPFVSAAKSDPGAAAGRIAENLTGEGREAAGPWLGLAVMVLGGALLLKRDKRLVLVGSLSLLVMGATLIFAGDSVVALIRGTIDRTFG